MISLHLFIVMPLTHLVLFSTRFLLHHAVSRCGMVYTEPSSLGIDVLLQSWTAGLPPCFTDDMRATLADAVDAYLRPALKFLRRSGVAEAVPTSDNALVRSLLNILDVFLEPYAVKEGRDPPSRDAVTSLASQLPALFMFSLVWSVGATSNAEGRRKMNAYLHDLMTQHAFPFPLPGGANNGSSTDVISSGGKWEHLPQLYDFAWDVNVTGTGSSGGGGWVPWMATVPAYEFPRGADYSEILVPTKDR